MLSRIKYSFKEIRHHLHLPYQRTSNLGEEIVIKKYLKKINKLSKVCVDIAASDGTTQSNTLFLYIQGWSGLALEYDPQKFAILASHYKSFPQVNLMKVKAVPGNAVSILSANMIPKKFGFLNLDIDSYDYYVLDNILSSYRPQLICTEVNEKIPPPYEFTVTYCPEHFWHGDHFYGQSICQLHKLCKKYNYEIVELYYNNAFLMPKELHNSRSLTPQEAYSKGYKNQHDRKQKFPWDADMEPLQTMSYKDGLRFIREKFAQYKGHYICR